MGSFGGWDSFDCVDTQLILRHLHLYNVDALEEYVTMKWGYQSDNEDDLFGSLHLERSRRYA